jgi:hypothetical protein
MRHRIQNCVFLLLTLVAGGCKRHSPVTGCPHDANLSTYKQWKESARFPYSASQFRREQIVKNYDRVGVGSTKEEFVEALGEPDYEQEMYPKEPNRPCMGYAFTYYFEKPDANLVSEIQDKRVEAFFSPAGKTIWVASNIRGLGEKGSPTINRKSEE